MHHRAALEARAQGCALGGSGGALCSPLPAASRGPATAPTPAAGAPPGWAGIDRRPGESIDFCAVK